MNKAFSLIELLVVISIISILASFIYTGLQDTKASALETDRYRTLQEYQNAINVYNHLNAVPLTDAVHRIAQSPSLVGGVLVSSKILNSVPLDPVYFQTTNSDGFIWCNREIDHTLCLGDNDPKTFAIRFKTDNTTFLGPAGFYCATSKGFTAVGEGLSIDGRIATNSIYQCVQA